MLAVQLYVSIASGSKPAGIPDQWPANVVELDPSVTSLPNPPYDPALGWLFWTSDQLVAQQNLYQAAYNTWLASLPVYTPQPVKTQVSSMLDADGVPMVRLRAFANPDNVAFAGQGFTGVAIAGTTTNIDFHIPSGRIINGTHVIMINQVYGDTASLQIVDKDAVYAPAGTVLNTFASSWNIDPTQGGQTPIVLPYKANIPPGVYIRLVYNSTGATNVNIAVNLFLHTQM